MSGIFLCVLLFCGAFGLMTGRGEALGLEVLAAGEDAVQLGLSLAGAYMVWSGLVKILERAGAVRALSRALRRPVAWLLGREGQDPEVREAVCVNFTANLLGLGNAATPLGLAAIQAMAERNPSRETPTRGMVLFVVMNTASLQLIPLNMAAMRQSAGSAQPFAILPAVWITSAASLAVCLAACKLLERSPLCQR